MAKGLTYRAAGVDIAALTRVKKAIFRDVRSTFSPRVIGDVGLFGGLFDIGRLGYCHPVLVSSIDGVGTKIKVAVAMGRHRVIGRDIVAHCVNDILTLGATPLFMLDYIGYSRLEPAVLRQLAAGMAAECRASGCVLIGGETAQMPGTYPADEYDLVGCIVGVVERGRILDGSRIEPGDRIIGLPSNGLHTNGYSLARKICFERLGLSPQDRVAGLRRSIGDELLQPHRNYLPAIRPLLKRDQIRALVHVTGGGLADNTARLLPKGTKAEFDSRAWKVPAIFRFLRTEGHLAAGEAYRAFNMGVGMAIVVREGAAAGVFRALRQQGHHARQIGEILPGCQNVEIL